MTLSSRAKSIKFFSVNRQDLLKMQKNKIIDKTKLVIRLYNIKMQNLIDISVENEALKRRIIYLEKRVKILNSRDNNYHNFTYPDATLKKQEMKRNKKV